MNLHKSYLVVFLVSVINFSGIIAQGDSNLLNDKVKRQQSELLRKCDCDTTQTAEVRHTNKYKIVKLNHPIYMGDDVILYFSKEEVLEKCKRLKKGFIKYNNSWAGSSNVQKTFLYNSDKLVVKIKSFSSHDRWFGKVERIAEYQYDDKGEIIRCKEVDRNGQVVEYKNLCKWL